MRQVILLLLLVWLLPIASAQRTYSGQFSHDGEWIIFLVEQDETFIKIVETSTGRIIRSMGPVPWMSFAKLSIDKQRIVTSRLLDDYLPPFHKKWTMTIWDTETGHLIKSLEQHNGGTFSPGGKWLFAGYYNVENKKPAGMIYETETGELLYIRKGKWRTPVYIDGQIEKWKVANKKVAEAISDSMRWTNKYERNYRSPDGKLIAEGNGHITIKEASTENVIYSLAHQGFYEDFIWSYLQGWDYSPFSADSKLLMTCAKCYSNSQTVNVYEASNGKLKYELPKSKSTSFSPNGKWIVDFGRSLKIYEATTGKLVHDIKFGIDQDI